MANYETEIYWKQYQEFFPSDLRIFPGNQPDEEWFGWRGASVHIDRFRSAQSPFTIILVHGAGGYGRLFAPIGRMLNNMGYEVVAPDLPGYGLSRADASLITYQAWLELLCDLVKEEQRKRDRPVVLFGGSVGGYLAYLCAARLPKDDIAGLVATTLADPRLPLVKQQFARNSTMLAMMPLMPLADNLFGGVKVPIRWFTKMGAISNNAELARLMSADPRGGGGRVPISFLKSIFDVRPDIEPEYFDRCPVLLVHPAEDHWTGLESSQQFLRRLQTRKRLVLLERCGHFPIEQPGLTQMSRALAGFLDELVVMPSRRP